MASSKLICYTVFMLLSSFGWFATTNAIDAAEVMRALLEGRGIEDQPISKEDEAIIHHWYNACNIDPAIDCSVNYIRELRRQLEKHRRVTTMSNIDVLYNHARFMIMWQCGAAVFQQGQQLDPILFHNGHFLNGIGSEFNKWLFNADDVAYRYMSEWMLWLLGTDKRSSMVEFVQAWRNGPCTAILSELDKPSMQAFANYMRMVSESQFDNSQLNHSRLRYYIKIVQSCQFLQPEQSLLRVWNALQDRDANLEESFRAEAIIGYNHDAFQVLDSLKRGIALKDQPIIERDQRIVQSWFELMLAAEKSQCSINTIRMLRQKLDSDKDSTLMSNMDGIYEFVVQKILSSCGKKVRKKLAEFGMILAQHSILGVFGSRFNGLARNRGETYKPLRVMSEWMLWMVGIEKRNNRQDFIVAWMNGPCKEVLAKLSGSDFRSVADYIQMIDESQFDPLRLPLSAVESYIPFILGCRHFQSSESLNEIWYYLQIRDTEVEERVRSNALFE